MRQSVPRHHAARTHHMFHRVPGPWGVRSVETATVVAYILGIGFVTGMFAMMATDWDVQSVLWGSSAGVAVVAMLISMVLRGTFEDMLCQRLRFCKRETPTGFQVYSRVPTNGPALMPRLTLLELLRDAPGM
jgi:hypothetical protein